MSPSVTPGHVSRAAVLEIGERLAEPPSERLTEIVFARELKAQLGLTRAIGWVDLAHTMGRHCHVAIGLAVSDLQP